MNRKFVFAMVMTLGMVMSTVSLALAGGGGAGTQIDAFALDCYLVNGTNPSQTVSLEDQFYPEGEERTGVKLGKAQLLCAPATVSVTAGTPPVPGFLTADHLLCYETPPAASAPKVLKQVATPFGTQNVTVGAPRFTCVSAFKCDPGTSCPAQ